MNRLVRRWRGPPLMMQILLLLLGGLVVAQLVTLVLTVLLPPRPAPQHSLAAVAAALNGVTPEEARPDRLERLVQAGPPDVARPGWLQSEQSRGALAGLLGVPSGEVRLAFYTPLPFAGVAPPRKLALLANDGPMAPPLHRHATVLRAQLPGPPPGMPPGGFRLPPPSTLPRLGRPPLGRDGLPGGLRGPDVRGGGAELGGAALPPRGGDAPLVTVAPEGGGRGVWLPGDGGAALPPLLQGRPPERPFARGAPPPIDAIRTPMLTMPALVLPAPAAPALPPPAAPRDAAVPSIAQTAPLSPAPTAPDAATPPLAMPSIPSDPREVAAPESPAPREAAIPLGPRPRTLFGFAPAPFVEGDFVAALRLGDGRWAVVQPAPEPFPNAWQRRLLLWFALAFAIVGPLGWLFARRVVKPLTGFAEAAERLGRDPAATVEGLDGPAEVGRAARAFNLMQSRLKSFVEDRTAYVGAISHDLRTPLTRLRFRIEEVDDEAVREGMIGEVEEMEAMIASVLAFIRDASAATKRERLDLRTIVDDVAEDAALVGGAVRVASGPALPVEVDVLGLRRLLANLIDNAVKYGGRADVLPSVERGEAVIAVVDAGPGLPDDEMERAFEPFYRAPAARSGGKAGHGLGLAVCRSIARAHGGDVRLRRSADGFTAELRVPLAFDAERALAA